MFCVQAAPAPNLPHRRGFHASRAGVSPFVMLRRDRIFPSPMTNLRRSILFVVQFAVLGLALAFVIGVFAPQITGRVRTVFGGDSGKEFELDAGDVAILPAGTGHQCLRASEDFSVVGAYPPGAKMQVTRPTPDNHAAALKTIPEVSLPTSDPVLGRNGPLIRLWSKKPM